MNCIDRKMHKHDTYRWWSECKTYIPESMTCINSLTTDHIWPSNEMMRKSQRKKFDSNNNNNKSKPNPESYMQPEASTMLQLISIHLIFSKINWYRTDLMVVSTFHIHHKIESSIYVRMRDTNFNGKKCEHWTQWVSRLYWYKARIIM